MSHEDNSKKPERNKRGRDDAEPTIDSVAQDIQSRFLEIQEHIQSFRKTYDALLVSTAERRERVQMRAREVNRSLGFFTPVVSDADRYLKMLELLYQQSYFLSVSFQLKDVLSNLLKDINMVGDMRKLFSFSHDSLSSYIMFVRTQVIGLVKGYHHSEDNTFKNEIKQKLDERPTLLAWLQPFLNPELGQDPLLVTVQTGAQEREKQRRLDEVEIVKGAFDVEVMEKLPLLQKAIKDQFAKMADFFEKGDAVERKTYRDKVQFYADFCVNISKGFGVTVRYILRLIESVDGYINKIRGIDHEGDVTELVAIISKLTQWEKKLSTELNNIYRPMQVIAQAYFQHKDELPHNLRAFMRPWLNAQHPSPLDASICAYERPNDFPEAVEPQPPTSAEEQAKQVKFQRQANRRV